MVGFPSFGDDGNFIGGFCEADADFTAVVSAFAVLLTRRIESLAEAVGVTVVGATAVGAGAVGAGAVITGVVAGAGEEDVANATPTHRWFRYEI